MAIPLVGLSVQTPDIGNAFLTGVYNGEDRQAAQVKMQADAQKSQMEARAAKLGQLSNMAFAISRIQDPKQRAAALDRGKQAIASMYGNDPETMRALAGVTADNVEGYAMTLTSIADHLKAGKTDAEIANIYNTMGNRDANTSSMISDRAARTGIYGSGVYNANANRDAMTGLAYDRAARTGYGQVPEGQVFNPQTGRAEDIPGAYRKPASAGVSVDPNTGALIVGAPKLTEAQSKDTGFLLRGTNANEGVNANERPLQDSYWSRRASEMMPFGIGNYFQSQEYQAAVPYASEFVNAINRKDSGAAITAEEWRRADRFLPLPGDNEQTLAVKRQLRQEALDAIRMGLGNAAPQMPGSDVPPGAAGSDPYADVDAIVGLGR